MALLEKQNLVNYMITKYKKEHNGERITPITLQKGLYFLYAFWGGKIRAQTFSSKNDEVKEMTEMSFNYEEDLFDAKFEAWTYGPVDREIYVWFKTLSDKEFDSINVDNLIGLEHYDVKKYIDDLLERIFNTSDFGLVDLSHEDRCWSTVYNPTHKNEMNNDMIKDEYAFR